MNLQSMKNKMSTVALCIKREKKEMHKCKSVTERAFYQMRMDYFKTIFRAMHIAYGLHRGYAFEQIESKSNIAPDWKRVAIYLKRLGFDPERYHNDNIFCKVPRVLPAELMIYDFHKCNDISDIFDNEEMAVSMI